MAHAKDRSGKHKISADFAARLDRLEPHEKIRAIVLLEIDTPDMATGRRQSRAERKSAIAAVRASAEQALADIDSILERFGGERLATRADALGSIPVATTAPCIHALAESASVKAILEDQRIYPQLTALAP